MTLQVYIGYDPRQPVAYNVLQHSIIRHASVPVSITPLVLSQLPIKRRGLTEFTYSRFLVPYLCGFKGTALFLDADMVVTGDIKELFDLDTLAAVSVMQDQAKFEWASAMLFKCGACLKLTPDFIDNPDNKLFDLTWGTVGQLPKKWNYCVGMSEPRDASLFHFTQGLPCWHETQGHPEDNIWHTERALLTQSVSWMELMGGSVHAEPVLRRMFARYGVG